MKFIPSAFRTRVVTAVTLAAFSASLVPAAAWAAPAPASVQLDARSVADAKKTYLALYANYQEHLNLNLRELKAALLTDVQVKMGQIAAQDNLDEATKADLVNKVKVSMDFVTRARSTFQILKTERSTLNRIYQAYHLGDVAGLKPARIPGREIADDQYSPQNIAVMVGLGILFAPVFAVGGLLSLLFAPFVALFDRIRGTND